MPETADSEPVPPRPRLQDMLADARPGVLLFGLTPPRRSESEERVREIAAVTLKRVAALDVDGLILYDIDDESDRNPDERPFPYLPTLDPARYHADHLDGWDLPAVIYRCVGKYPENDLRGWLERADPERILSVFVGASSGDKEVRTDMRRAQALRRQVRPDLPLGAVVIGERHARHRDEHLRMLAKQERGATFFVSQVTYNLTEARNLVSDYVYECRRREIPPRTVIFTLSLCGSPKTLEFVRWLGVDVPRWLENSIRHASDPLAESYRQAMAIARDLIEFCEELGMPYGFNVESVSIRRSEIEASTHLTSDIAALLHPASR